MHQIKTGIFFLLLSIIIHSNLQAQNTVSPYSGYGIGIMSERAYAPNLGMGKTGIAYSSPWFVPVLNPALLGDQSLTSFEAGLAVRKTAIRDDLNRFDQLNGGLQYIALALPIIPNKLGASISLNPYVSRKYSIAQSFDNNINLRPLAKLYTGSGNISQFRLSAGYNLNKNISIGAEANYNFGQTTELVSTQGIIQNQDTIAIPYSISANKTYNYSDFSYLLGVLYRKPLANKNILAIGATYSFKANLNTERSKALQITNAEGEPLSGTDYSNFQYFEEEGITTIPGKLSTGISFYKVNNWAVSLDYSYQDWTQFEQYAESPNNLVANNAIKVGGEFTPNIYNGEKYFQRITYRAGVHLDNGPVKINNQQINSFGITFGVTAPINKISNINIGMELGQRGTLEQSLVKENYFGVNLSFTYNDRWFLRRQFD